MLAYGLGSALRLRGYVSALDGGGCGWRDPVAPAVKTRYIHVMELLNVWDYEAAAAAVLDEGAHGYYAGGAGDEVTLRDNVDGFRRWVLRPRVLVDIAWCTTRTTVLGRCAPGAAAIRGPRSRPASTVRHAGGRWAM